jgi:hypothetical protein
VYKLPHIGNSDAAGKIQEHRFVIRCYGCFLPEKNSQKHQVFV